MKNWISYKGEKLTEPQEVEGFDKLSNHNKVLFTNFLETFYKVWEFAEDHQPIGVKFVVKEHYLKVIFVGEWLHVTTPKNWY